MLIVRCREHHTAQLEHQKLEDGIRQDKEFEGGFEMEEGGGGDKRGREGESKGGDDSGGGEGRDQQYKMLTVEKGGYSRLFCAHFW